MQVQLFEPMPDSPAASALILSDTPLETSVVTRNLPARPTPVINDKYAQLWTRRQLEAYADACYDAGFHAGRLAAENSQ
ncbi:hypothetical protein GSY71_10265 [Pusillimonas sp. TS35]|uniref:hypothetical protein n=1 Tax=Paracandidimonas lactea TaxID=2895524 RepID=UPI001369F57B|nr:hypothetical protein [Paracandidimonas lactea]MYN13519.1 hypothetical protein [Pusillimonas sp. TS35]